MYKFVSGNWVVKYIFCTNKSLIKRKGECSETLIFDNINAGHISTEVEKRKEIQKVIEKLLELGFRIYHLCLSTLPVTFFYV